MDPGQRT